MSVKVYWCNFAVQEFFLMNFSVLFLWLLFALASCKNADTLKNNKVVGIADGDTFTLLTPENKQLKIRLYGIDCPERKQDYGNVAKQKLGELIFGQPVTIVQKEVDRYGRTVAIVYIQNGLCINEQMLREGLAWHYRQYDKNPAWDALEATARAQHKGLWAVPNPTPPWLFRKDERMHTAQ